MVHAGVSWSGTETNVHSNRAECNNLNDVHLWECYIVLIKSVSVIVYCGVHEWLLHAWLNCCVNFHQVEEFLGMIALLMKFSPIYLSINLCNKQGALADDPIIGNQQQTLWSCNLEATCVH